MESKRALEALSALSHETRLSVFRLLVTAGPGGLSAGVIAEQLTVLPNTLSTHLGLLARAGLVVPARNGRTIRYSANYDGMRELMAFLVRDCCAGNPEICSSLVAVATLGATDQRRSTEKKHMSRIYNVLFLCTGNSARSIMAEAILGREGFGRFKAYSAGSYPKDEIHPFAYEFLEGLNYDMSFARSKSWDEFAEPGAPDLDFVFTVCDQAAVEPCPTWPGQPMSAHWGLPDPAAVTGSEAERRFAFADAYRMLFNRISIFVNLPIASLDELSLQRQLEDIGQRRASAAPTAPE